VSEDEKVEGGKLAAQILNSMPASKKQSLLHAIRSRSPEAYQKIEHNVILFNQIPQLDDRGLQLLVKEIDHQELVLALKGAGAEVKEALLRNMSKGKVKLVEEDLAALPRTARSEVEAAQKRIIQKIDELRTAGALLTKAEEDEQL
jgi:flagellar motor switch protein FliG